MKFILTVLLFFILLSCNSNQSRKENPIQKETSTTTEGVESAPRLFDAETSLILLPRDGYKTYRDHYVCLSNEEYFGANKQHISHLEDTISTGMLNNDNRQTLTDSLRLDMDWLCIRFLDSQRADSFALSKVKTVSYTFNDMIEFVPLTLLSPQNTEEEYVIYDIAFRGDYEKSDFKLMEGKQLSADERKAAVQTIQKMLQSKYAIPPRPMSTDTLLLDNMYRIWDNTIVAKYVATAYNDSDGDYGNEAIFVLQDSKVKGWFAGMSCGYNAFELKKEKYLYINVNTYATSRQTLLKLTDTVEEVYTYLLFGD